MKKVKTTYTTGDVAKMRGCSPATIVSEIKNGNIHAVKNGKRNAIPAAEYQRLEREMLGGGKRS